MHITIPDFFMYIYYSFVMCMFYTYKITAVEQFYIKNAVLINLQLFMDIFLISYKIVISANYFPS